jgi:hypothetical protein
VTEALNPVDPAAGTWPADDAEELQHRRSARLLTGLRSISGRTSGIDGERLLFLLGAIAVPLGVVLVLIGWYGVAGSGLVFEQMPYAVSGGIGGLGLIVIGCTLYGCWWVTRAIRDQRERHDALTRQNEELVEAVRELRAEIAELGAGRKRR